uniref:Uncharacterized protein n=1 Tax=Gossypium raimondii TaxID=29730 RepID=A0A0D2S6Q8_GOSRA|nr:hypothetical protein B456_013G020400 [Gossypium raimondii]
MTLTSSKSNNMTSTQNYETNEVRLFRKGRFHYHPYLCMVRNLKNLMEQTLSGGNCEVCLAFSDTSRPLS